MKTNYKFNSLEMTITWFFLISTAVIALNQIVGESKLFELPSQQIYRFFILFSYCTCILIIFSFASHNGIDITGINTLVFLIMLLILISNLINGINITDSIISTCWGISFITGYALGKSGVFAGYRKTRIIIFIAIALFSFYSMYSNSIKANGVTNIIGVNYIFYFGFPLYVRFADENNPKTEILLSVIFIIATFISYKRTSLIAVGLALIIYYYNKYARKKSIKMKWLFLLSIIVFIIIAWYANKYTDGRLLERFSEIKSTGGNGREEIWKKTLELYSNSNFWQKCFGHGSNTVIKSIYMNGYYLSAHNDFLEVLYDYGWIALILYLVFIIRIFALTASAKRNNSPNSPLFSAVFVLFIVISLFSHAELYSYVALPLFSLLGALYAINRPENINERCSIK